ncbi:tRNA-dihydrouridine synthase family protein [Chitinispirillales bacterium ANBcel5]|uniref:tRNA-dihydrouridine synthase family protein n=1 Tax=Cellulosispirillum alkaliphilum TaxID=3039283 RepID=UPI002A564780|nr:tRNA-dihydrouridine synthase family protein [Chitinispirillales bacterium ANBcel5]
MRGITDQWFRQIYEKHYGKFDYILTPFIPTVKGKQVRKTHIRDIHPRYNDLTRVIPQIIGNDSEGFLLLCSEFSNYGFKHVNWNLGCPSPLITRKKRGSGLLPYPDSIKKILDNLLPKLNISLSIKVRLGHENPDELKKLIPVLNDYPIKELIIHPRTGIQMYTGEVDLKRFEVCNNLCNHPIVYNGDICSASDLQHLSFRFASVNKWMIGRGIIKDPALLSNVRGVTINDPKKRFQSFHDELLELNCSALSTESKILGKMKELWGYLGEKLSVKSLLRTESLKSYKAEAGKLIELKFK